MSETPKPVENFYKSLSEPNWWHMQGSKILNGLENYSFEASFMYLNYGKNYTRRGLDYKIVHKIICSSLFQKCVNPDAQIQWTGLTYGKARPFTKEVMRLGHDCPPWPAQLGVYGQSTLWGYLPQIPFYSRSLAPRCMLSTFSSIIRILFLWKVYPR